MQGSIVNRIMENAQSQELFVGQGVTECMWSDREPWEIIEVTDSRHITIRKLDAKRVDNNGLSEWQEYEYTSNADNETARLFRNKNGKWVRRYGRNSVDSSSGWHIGHAEKYWDPTF